MHGNKAVRIGNVSEQQIIQINLGQILKLALNQYRSILYELF